MSNDTIKNKVLETDFDNGKKDREEGKYDSPSKWYDNIIVYNEERNERTKAYNAGYEVGRPKK